MARFQLTAQLQLQAASSSNINSALSQMQNQLGKGLTVKINVAGAQNAANQLNRLQSQTRAVTTAAEEMGAAFGASLKRFAGFAVATRVVSLFTNKLGDAIDDAITFEQEMVRLGQVMDVPVKNLESLNRQVTLLSTSFGISSKEILSVATTLAQAGLSARDTEVALTTLAKTKLAPSFGKISDTTEGAIAIMAQFGQGAGALEKQLGAVNQVAAKFAVESQDLIDVIRRSGGVFKASGGSLEELLALFTSVRATTRESAESISTGLRTIFTRIQRPDTIYNLHKLGIELQDVDGKFVGPYEATKRLSQALKDLPEGSQKFISIGEELGGFRQIGKVIPLLQQFELAEKARQVAIAGGDSLTKDAASGQKALAVQIAKVREEFLALVRDIAGTDSFKFFITQTLNLTSSLIKVVDALRPLIPLLATLGTIQLGKAIGPFAASVGAGLRGRAGFASGGLVPGTGNTDTVPAMLTPGEFVIKKSSVQSIGADRLHSMNKYAAGGVVTGGRSHYGSNTAQSVRDSYPDLNLPQNVAGVIAKQLNFNGKSSKLEEYKAKSAQTSAPSSNTQKTLHLKDGVVGGLFLQLGDTKNTPKTSKVNAQFDGPIAGFPGAVGFDGNIDVGMLKSQATGDIQAVVHPYIAKAINDAVKVTAANLNVPPLHADERAVTQDALKNIDLSSIEGHIFEGYIRGLSGSELSAPGATFDFPNVSSTQRNRLSRVFDGKLAASIFDAKRAFTHNSLNGKTGSIAAKIVAGMKSKPQLITRSMFKDADTTQLGLPFENQKLASGGVVDSVPAMLTPGEFVVNKNAAQRIGYSNLHSMNNVGHYATGGTVTTNGPQTQTNGGFNGVIALTVLSSAIQYMTQFADKTSAAGKGIQTFSDKLVLLGATMYLLNSGIQKFSDYANSSSNKVQTYQRARIGFNSAQSNLDSASAAIDAKLANASPAGRAHVERYGNLQTRIEQGQRLLQRAKDSGNLGRANNIAQRLAAMENGMRIFTNQATAAAKSMAAEIAARNRLIPVLQAARKNLNETPRANIFEKAAAGVEGLIGGFSKVANVATLVVSAFTAVTSALSAFYGALSEDQSANGNYEEAKSAFAKSRNFGGIFGDKTDFNSMVEGGYNYGKPWGFQGTFAAAGALAYGYRWLTGADETDRIAKNDFTAKAIENNRALTEQDLNDTKLSSSAKSARVLALLETRKKQISDFDNDPAKKRAAQQAYDADLLKYAHSVGTAAHTTEEINQHFEDFKNKNKDSALALENMRKAVVAAKNAQEDLVKVQLDQLHISSVLGAGSVALKNFVTGLETGSNTLDSVINILNEAEKNPFISADASAALNFGVSSVRQITGIGGANTPAGAALDRLASGAQDSLAFNAALGKYGEIKVANQNPANAKVDLEKIVKGFNTTGNKQIANIIEEEIHKSEDPARDIKGVVEKIQNRIGDTLQKPLTAFFKDANAAQAEFVALTKKRIALEHEAIQSQKIAIDLTLEGAEAAHDFGGELVTGAQKSAAAVAKFNVGNSRLGISGLQGANAQDVLSASQEITSKFNALERKAQGGSGAFRGVTGLDQDKRAELVAKNKELIEINKVLIANKKEELDLVRKKNEAEKDALQKLLGGDIEGFLKGQQAAAAGAAIRSGNLGLVSQFSTTAIGGALKNAQESGASPQEVAQVAAIALKSVGITDQRSAQVLSGTTAEEERLSREGRALAGAQGQLGANVASMDNMQVQTATIYVTQAQVAFSQAAGGAAVQVPGKAHGGMILHAANGMFVPRGSDTVPAMLTPGEMVMNTRATSANRNALEAMNAGGGGGGLSMEVASMLANSLSGFSDAVNKLGQMKISVKLDTTNVNVNFTGGSFLQGMTEQIKTDLMAHVANEIKNLRQNADGGFSTDKVKPVLS